jgi:hypothetical protein
VIWSVLLAILLIIALVPQGTLICYQEWGRTEYIPSHDVAVTGIVTTSDPAAVAELENSTLPLDDLIHMVEIDTCRYIDANPRLFPVGVNSTLTNRMGDCTDLALLRVEVLNKAGIRAHPVYGIMLWDTDTFKTQAIHLEIFGTGISVHDWVEIDGGRTLGAFEGQNGIRCIKIGDGVCFQPIFEALGYL